MHLEPNIYGVLQSATFFFLKPSCNVVMVISTVVWEITFYRGVGVSYSAMCHLSGGLQWTNYPSLSCKYFI